MIRFTTCCGSGCLPSGPEEFSEILKQLFPAASFPKLNEVPASIAQLLKKRVHGVLVDQLQLVASEHNMVDELLSYFNHYPPQKE
jgi:hypothetical protein